MAERLSSDNNANDAPPLYRDDKAWTKERGDRKEQIHRALIKDETDHKAILELRDLIIECRNAVRSSPDRGPQRLPSEDSVILQELLTMFFDITRNKV